MSKNGHAPAEWYRRHRPQALDEVVGQPSAVKALRGLLDSGSFPHTVLFSGPSGCGKTTLARIVASLLGCPEGSQNFILVNCATVEEPLDTVRKISVGMHRSPWAGKNKVYLCEEYQSWSRAGFSQQAMLTMLEDTPSHVYFLLCTTDTEKIHKAIRTRATRIELKPLSEKDLRTVLKRVAKKEGIEPGDSLVTAVAHCSGGSPRDAVKQLQKAMSIGDEEGRLASVTSINADDDAGKIIGEIVFGSRNWGKVARVLSEVNDDAESIRLRILGTCRGILLKNEDARKVKLCRDIVQRLRDPYFDNGGKALLAADLYDLCGVKG